MHALNLKFYSGSCLLKVFATSADFYEIKQATTTIGAGVACGMMKFILISLSFFDKVSL